MGKGDPKGGAPRKEIDFELLDNLVRIHCTAEECAGILGVGLTTLGFRIKERGQEGGVDATGDEGFHDLYKRLSFAGKASLRRLQWKSAERLNTTMLIWLGKQWLDQTDKLDFEHHGPDGGAIRYERVEHVIIDPNDPSTWYDEADTGDQDAPEA